jgi:DNA-binding transcriptional regulator YhcF (GntR family)
MESQNLKPIDCNNTETQGKFRDIEKLRAEKQKLGRLKDPFLMSKREEFIDELIDLGFPIEKIYELVDK